MKKFTTQRNGQFPGFAVLLCIAAIFSLALLGCDTGNGPGNNFVPVTNISNLPQISIAGSELELSGTVEPSNATNQTIIWTGTEVTNGIFKATTTGDKNVTATITSGASESSPYTKTFTIKVYNSDTAKIDSLQGA